MANPVQWKEWHTQGTGPYLIGHKSGRKSQNMGFNSLNSHDIEGNKIEGFGPSLLPGIRVGFPLYPRLQRPRLRRSSKNGENKGQPRIKRRQPTVHAKSFTFPQFTPPQGARHNLYNCLHAWERGTRYGIDPWAPVSGEYISVGRACVPLFLLVPGGPGQHWGWRNI